MHIYTNMQNQHALYFFILHPLRTSLWPNKNARSRLSKKDNASPRRRGSPSKTSPGSHFRESRAWFRSMAKCQQPIKVLKPNGCAPESTTPAVSGRETHRPQKQSIHGTLTITCKVKQYTVSNVSCKECNENLTRLSSTMSS